MFSICMTDIAKAQLIFVFNSKAESVGVFALLRVAHTLQNWSFTVFAGAILNGDVIRVGMT
jgi:hypothetical protein